MPTTKLKPTATPRGELARMKLLETAHGLFIRHGFHGTSMRQIAAAAGVAVGGIYNHFHDKEAIFAAVLDAYHPYHQLLPVLSESPSETVEEFVQETSEYMRAQMPRMQKQILPLVFMELVEFQGRHLKQLATRIFPVFMSFVEGLASKRGRLRPLPPPVLLRAYLALMIGFLLSEMLLKDTPMFKSGGPDALTGMIDIYLHGILEPEA